MFFDIYSSSCEVLLDADSLMSSAYESDFVSLATAAGSICQYYLSCGHITEGQVRFNETE